MSLRPLRCSRSSRKSGSPFRVQGPLPGLLWLASGHRSVYEDNIARPLISVNIKIDG